jgi:hypothetical protein
MAISNVAAGWDADGRLTYRSKTTGQELLTFDPIGEEVVIPTGSGLTVDGDSYVVTAPDGVTIEVNGDDELAVVEGGIGLAHLASAVTDLLDLVAAIPTADQEDGETVWNDGGVLKVSSAGE